MVLAQLTKGLETEVSHMASQPGLYDQAAMKTGQQGSGELPCLQILHARCYKSVSGT